MSQPTLVANDANKLQSNMPPMAVVLGVTLAAAAVASANVNSSLETAESQAIEGGGQIDNVSVEHDENDDRHNNVSEEIEYQLFDIDDPG